MKYVKSISTITAFALGIAILGGIGSVALDRYVIPTFADAPIFSRFGFLKKATENTTIINKTEQLIVREDDSVEKITSQPSTAVVKIMSTIHGTHTLRGDGVTLRSGSGVLVTNDGLIITSKDAILENARYTAVLFNGAVHTMELVGSDPYTNLVYMKIDATNVPAISFSNSDDLRTGKRLIALSVGNSDYQDQFSLAMLNGKDQTYSLSEKTVSSSEKHEGMFLVDFPHQEKYVGGPVINYNGEMIGLMTATTIDNQHQYVVLPANIVKESLDTYLNSHFSKRPTLGVYYKSITKDIQSAYNLKKDAGAWLYSPTGKTYLTIIAGSPAEKAKLQANDIITAINDTAITLDMPLSRIISHHEKGETIQLHVWRNEQEIVIPVTL